MIEYGIKYSSKLWDALWQHLELVFFTLLIALCIAAILTILAVLYKRFASILLQIFSTIYAIPSLALFALLIPFTGLGTTTAILVIVIYSQYILLGNFITGLQEVDPFVIEAAKGIGMSPMQILYRVQFPLAKKALFTGIRLTIISTISIATIAAMINAGGLGSILFDGLRTMNVIKILWGSILSAGLAIGFNSFLGFVEKKL